MIKKELVEALKSFPDDAEIERGDSNNCGDPIETPVNRVESNYQNGNTTITLW